MIFEILVAIGLEWFLWMMMMKVLR